MGGLGLKVLDGSSRIRVILFPKCSKFILYIKNKQQYHMLTLSQTHSTGTAGLYTVQPSENCPLRKELQ